MTPLRYEPYVLSFVQSLGSNFHPHVQATAALNTKFYTSPACITALSQILADSPDQPVSSIIRVDSVEDEI